MHILAPYVSCVVFPHELEEALAQEYKQIYILTSKGILKHHVLRGEGRFVRTKVESIPGYTEPKLDQGMNFLPAGKIPYELLEQVQAFFVKVMEVKTAELEAMIHILWNPEQGYHLGVPPQRISKASVSYDWDYIPQGTSIIVDIHSHNTMGAFFSGTDDRDDRGNISFSGVFGKLKNAVPDTIWRFNYMDKKFEATIDQIFEAPERPEVEIPEEWMNQIQVYTPPVYKGGYSGLGNVGGYQSPATRPGASAPAGKTPDQLRQDAVWRGNSTPTQSPAANRAANAGSPAQNTSNFPRQSGNAHRTGNDFEFGGLEDFAGYEGGEDALRHFFGFDGGNPQYGLPAPGIPTQSEAVGGVEDDAFPFAFGGTTTEVSGRELNRSYMVDDEDPVGPPFGSISAIEDPDAEEADRVGKSSGELALLDEARLSQSDTSINGYTEDPEYEAIKAIHGEEVADAWRNIAYSMSTLDGLDELNQELICDMAGLSTEQGQLKIVRELFSRLSSNNRMQIETNGL